MDRPLEVQSAVMRPCREPGRPPLLPLCLYEFSLQSDGDVVTDKNAAGLEGSISLSDGVGWIDVPSTDVA